MDSGKELTYLLQLWTMFATLPLADNSVVQLRKDVLTQLLQVLHLRVPDYDPQFYKMFLLPCLNLEAAILETDKVNGKDFLCVSRLGNFIQIYCTKIF